MKSSVKASEKGEDDEEDRDDPFDSDVTSEEDSGDLMPERADEEEETNDANELITAELVQQAKEETDLINEELARSGAEKLEAVPNSDALPENLDAYVGDQAYQMY